MLGYRNFRAIVILVPSFVCGSDSCSVLGFDPNRTSNCIRDCFSSTVQYNTVHTIRVIQYYTIPYMCTAFQQMGHVIIKFPNSKQKTDAAIIIVAISLWNFEPRHQTISHHSWTASLLHYSTKDAEVMAPPSHWRTSICHKRLQLSSVVLWTVIIVSCLCQACDAQNSSSVTQTILAHPSMFGSPWTGAVTAAVLKTTIDLCDENVEPSSTTENIFITSLSMNELNDQYEIAIFYDDPSSEEEKCQYSQMAETAERLYPSAKYLLVSKDIFSAMTKGDDEPDTNLSLASIQRDDAIAINNMLRNNTGVSISEGVVLLRIDAYSRAYIDTCNCTEDETVAERKRMWTITLRVSSVLSILGSNYIILSLIGTGARRKKNLQLLFNRLLISICCFDIISSFAIFWGAWAEPSQPPGDFEKFYSQGWSPKLMLQYFYMTHHHRYFLVQQNGTWAILVRTETTLHATFRERFLLLEF